MTNLKRVDRRQQKSRRRASEEVARLCASLPRVIFVDRAKLNGLSAPDQELVGQVNSLVDTLTAPLVLVTRLLNKLGHGEIPPHSDASDTGAFGDLQHGMYLTIEQIERLTSGIRFVAAETAKGRIDESIDTAGLRGVFAEVGEVINQFGAEHLATERNTLTCIDQFGRGNFDAPLKQYPGKRAFINESVECLRGNLRALLTSLKSVAEDHLHGNVEITIPLEKFEGSFTAMARAVNEMAAEHVAVQRKMAGFMQALGKGDFNATLEPMPGDRASSIDRRRGTQQL